jgi:methylenetetrahydrofolate dehydrogenase (NADP+)/methenyltetrahydrofolate cyclohydrolase
VKSEKGESPRILDGRALSATLREELKQRVEVLTAKGHQPGLGVVLVGEDPASVIYVGQKEKSCKAVGINSRIWRLEESTSEEELLALVEKLNRDETIHGVLVQLPLPNQIEERHVIEAVSPEKDVDGFHPISMGRLLSGEDGFVSCTPQGIIRMLNEHQIPMKGQEAVIIGRSNIVGKPMAVLLLREHATVTICHSRTKDLASHVRRADLLVAAVGRARLVQDSWVKEGAVIIDVGMNRTEEGKLVGDVDFEGVLPKVSAITPVPGGVGPMTITMLLHNTILAAEKKAGLGGGQ